MHEFRVEPGYGNSLVIAALMAKLGEDELLLTERDLMSAGRLIWTTKLGSSGDSTSCIRLRLVSEDDPMDDMTEKEGMGR
jgi:hypothetical protein